MDRASLRGKVQTVRGLIEPDALGPTLMHEHLLCDLVPPRNNVDDGPDSAITLETAFEINYGRVPHGGKFRLDRLDHAIAEVLDMRDAGGRAIVELTCGGLKPDPEGLRRIAEAADVHIVMGCGHYVEEYQDPRNFELTVEDFAAEMVAQVFEGAWGTGVRAGIIGEIGCQSPWTELEKRVMRGAVLAQGETGAALNVHPGRQSDQPREVVALVREAGGDVERTIISHIDRTIFDEERLLRLADSGCVIEYDFFGWESTYYPLADVDLPNDGMRLAFIRTLIDHGHLSRIVISHDICTKTRLRRFGGHGYGHIFANVVPLMQSRGFTEDEIRALLFDNPRRLLTIQ